jgi:hypothetical protein
VYSREKHILFLVFVGLSGWLIPGAGHFILRQKKRAALVFITIILTFTLGLYIGSIGVINPANSMISFIGQLGFSPAVGFVGTYNMTLLKDSSKEGFPVYGKPNEIGQIYTSTAGLLNLLCIVNAIYVARIRWLKKEGLNVS